MSEEIKLSIEHPKIVEAAGRAFWDACRVQLGQSMDTFTEMWRDPEDEYSVVRTAIFVGMMAAMKRANNYNP